MYGVFTEYVQLYSILCSLLNIYIIIFISVLELLESNHGR